MRLGTFLGQIGKNMCVFVGFGPKRASGTKISGGTGVRPSVMDGLLKCSYFLFNSLSKGVSFTLKALLLSIQQSLKEN